MSLLGPKYDRHEPDQHRPVRWGTDRAHRRCLSAVPLGGWQTAEQVADVMAWPLGDGAAHLTGQTIAVGGGFTNVQPLVK